MSDKKIIAAVIVGSLLLLIGGVVLASRAPTPPKISASQEAKVEVDATNHDWGEIPINGGDVEKTFTLKDIGTVPLELANVKTSCMCTEAQIVIGDQQSPLFGMHPTSSWLGKVPPDEEAKLRVIFDPAFHGPSGIGQITRTVSLETNDKDKPSLEFTLTANVVN